MHDGCVVPLDDTPDLAVGVQVFRVGDVGKDASSQHQFLSFYIAQYIIGADSDNLCRVAEDCA
jgi:hypothetical protein